MRHIDPMVFSPLVQHRLRKVTHITQVGNVFVFFTNPNTRVVIVWTIDGLQNPRQNIEVLLYEKRLQVLRAVRSCMHQTRGTWFL